MLYVIYGAVLIFLIVIIYGAWARKKIYKEVDRLGLLKVQLMNEPVTQEMAKIKGLKMSGETEERFEEWREEWDSIVTVQLPDMEEKLFDIEEMANKYRFQKAKQYIRFVDEELNNVHEQMKKMIAEIDELVHSEQQNRQDVSSVKDRFDETKKKLWVQKGTLGQAAPVLEQRLKEVQRMFVDFDSQTDEGNYFQAREILVSIEGLLDDYSIYMDEVPQYLVKIEKDLPKQLEDLEKGLSEMESDGYPVKHYSYYWQVNDMKRRLLAVIPLVENLKLAEAKQPVERVEEELNDIYERLEHEALARNFVEKEFPELKKRLSRVPEQFEKLTAETESIKLNYRLDEEHDKHQLQQEKAIKELFNQFAVLEDAFEEKKQSFTALRKMTKEFQTDLEGLEEDIAETKQNLNHLLSDEREAEETIKDVKNSLLQGQKNLRRSNIPGISEHIMIKLDDAEELIEAASEELNQIPISMRDVNEKAARAKSHVEKCVKELNALIEQARLAELVIQFGNRYRSHHDQVNIKLLQAEDRFRNYLYEEALELALEAVEPVDPNVLEKIKEQENIQVSYS